MALPCDLAAALQRLCREHRFVTGLRAGHDGLNFPYWTSWPGSSVPRVEGPSPDPRGRRTANDPRAGSGFSPRPQPGSLREPDSRNLTEGACQGKRSASDGPLCYESGLHKYEWCWAAPPAEKRPGPGRPSRFCRAHAEAARSLGCASGSGISSEATLPSRCTRFDDLCDFRPVHVLTFPLVHGSGTSIGTSSACGFPPREFRPARR
jgi:hypothetical protein